MCTAIVFRNNNKTDFSLTIRTQYSCTFEYIFINNYNVISPIIRYIQFGMMHNFLPTYLAGKYINKKRDSLCKSHMLRGWSIENFDIHWKHSNLQYHYYYRWMYLFMIRFLRNLYFEILIKSQCSFLPFFCEIMHYYKLLYYTRAVHKLST